MIPSGTLPRAYEGMASMKYLSLRYNNISGTIPPAYGRMTAMKTLRMDLNSLSGTLPGGLRLLTDLTAFTLADNPRLSGSFPSWGNMTKMTALNMQHTAILPGLLPDILSKLFHTFPLLHDIGLGTETSGTIPAISPRMEALTWLLLPNTNISGTLPANITTITHLSNFDLQGTKIAGPLPEADLPSLFECTFNATYDSGAIAMIKVDPTCNGSITSNGTDLVPNRCL